jgi:hypothetical protein
MGKINFGFKLPVVFLREKGRFIAYSPVLDLSTSGKTFKEAQKRFIEIAVIFFKEIIKKGTINEVLAELGWQKIKKEWKPPVVVSHQPEIINVPVSV